MFTKRGNSEIKSILPIEQLKATIDEIKKIKKLDDERLIELKQQLNDIVGKIYAPLLMLNGLHKAPTCSQLADYIITDQISLSSSTKNPLAALHSLCDELLIEVVQDEARFRETFKLIPKDMTKKALSDLVNCYDGQDGDQEDFLIILLKKYMETEEFQTAKDNDSVQFYAFFKSHYYTINANSKGTESFLYQLLSFPSTEIMKRKVHAEAVSNNEDVTSKMPYEVWQYIFGQLSDADFPNTARACRFFRVHASVVYLQRLRMQSLEERDYTKVPKHKYNSFESSFRFKSDRFKNLHPNNDFVSVNRDTFVVMGENSVYVFDFNVRAGGSFRLRNIHALNVSARAIMALPTNQLLTISYPNTIKIWDLTKGECIKEKEIKGGYFNACIRTNEGNIIFLSTIMKSSGAEGSNLYDYSLVFCNQNLEEIKAKVHLGEENKWCVPKFLANDTNDKIIWLYSATDELKIREIDGSLIATQSDQYHSICPLAQNRLAVSSNTYRIAILDMTTLKPLYFLPSDSQKGRFNQLKSLPNNYLLASNNINGDLLVTIFDSELKIVVEWDLKRVSENYNVMVQLGNVLILDYDQKKIHTLYFPALLDQKEQEMVPEPSANVQSQTSRSSHYYHALMMHHR